MDKIDKLLHLVRNLVYTEDDTGCSGDLTVVSKKTFDELVEFAETYKNSHQVVDFGHGPKDCSSYPFEGTEEECSRWIEEHQETKDGRDRYGLQEIPSDL